MIQRVLAAAGLIVAFVFMASVFSPSDSRAGQSAAPAIRLPTNAATVVRTPDSTEAPSTDAHSGLSSLGEIQTNTYIVRIYSTSVGPRYTIIDRRDDGEVATLMSAEDVAKFFPELPLSEIEFGTTKRSGSEASNPGSGPLMMADTPCLEP